MPYVDAILDRKNDRILVAERVNGTRRLIDFPAEYVFYHEHGSGMHRSIFGHSCKKFVANTNSDFRKEIAIKKKANVRTFEADVNPIFRALADRYTGAETPKLNLCFFDIEVDFDPDRGFAPTDNAFNKVTAISAYLSHTGILHTFALKPPTITDQDGEIIAARFENTTVFAKEELLLEAFLKLIDDADVLSGWNSEGYDIPYLVNRVSTVLGARAKKRFCLWGQYPREREYKKFGKLFKTYDLVGRVHLDYLLLYQKHNTQQQHSYRLDYIGEIEVGEQKIHYDGTLDQLYKNDFEKFIEYNRQDVLLLVKIDAKRKFIELANQIAHGNTVLLKTTMGSVALVETAITNAMHKMNLVVPSRVWDRDQDNEVASEGEEDGTLSAADGRTPVVGAYVAAPKIGLHSHVGACDVNSLYPHAIIAFNMSPETLIGHVHPTQTMALVAQRIAAGTPRAEAWEGIFVSLEVEQMQARSDTVLTIDFVNHLTDVVDSRQMTGAQLHDYVFDPANHCCITPNGTLFRTDVDGIIPTLLTEWYAERKQLQTLMEEWTLRASTATPEELVECRYWIAFYDQRQLAKKILLNSLYGALLNEAMLFYDERLGQSTTLSGRSVVKHMNAKINESITGQYDYRGAAIIYADTDSCYFSAYEVLKDDPLYAGFNWSRENIIELYDAIAEEANDSFPDFLAKSFNTSMARGAKIKAGRELIGSKALFIKKKKYAVLMYDKDGKRLDVGGKPGKLKAMGLDLKRADTPKFMQKFLEKLLMDLLTDRDQQLLYDDVKAFRTAFKQRPPWEKGSPKKVSNLSSKADELRAAAGVGLDGHIKTGQKLKVAMPGHVRASLNWNDLCEMHNDRYAARISDGSRIIVCKLKPSNLKMTSVAYPVDEMRLPEWYKSLPFDQDAMEESIIDNKLDNLVGVLDWDLTKTRERTGDEFFVWN